MKCSTSHNIIGQGKIAPSILDSYYIKETRIIQEQSKFLFAILRPIVISDLKQENPQNNINILKPEKFFHIVIADVLYYTAEVVYVSSAS